MPIPAGWPLFAVPAGSCDTHCHIMGPADRFPYAEQRSYTRAVDYQSAVTTTGTVFADDFDGAAGTSPDRSRWGLSSRPRLGARPAR